MAAQSSWYWGIHMRRHLTKLYNVSGAFAAILIFAICLLVSAQVIANLITKLFGTSVALTIPSYADFSGYFLAASSFMALAYTFKHDGHIRVLLVRDTLKANLKNTVDRFVLFIAAVTASYMTYYMALLTLEAYEFGDQSFGIVAIPLFIPQFFVFLGLLIFSISIIDNLFSSIKPEETTPDEQELS